MHFLFCSTCRVNFNISQAFITVIKYSGHRSELRTNKYNNFDILGTLNFSGKTDLRNGFGTQKYVKKHTFLNFHTSFLVGQFFGSNFGYNSTYLGIQNGINRPSSHGWILGGVAFAF
jgi:hypothetical protein